MHEWKAHLWMEWKLLLRNRMVHIIILLGAVVGFLLHLAMRDLQHIEEYAKSFLHMYVWGFSLVANLYGVYIAQRDEMIGIREIGDSWSFRTKRLLLARLLVSLIPFLVLALVPFFMYTLFSILYKFTLVWSVVWILASSVVTMVYSLVVGMVIGGLVLRSASYLIAFLVWLGQSMITYYYFARLLPSSVGYMGFVIPFDFEALGYYTGLFGFHIDPSYWGQRGFYFFFAIVLILLLIGVKAWSRKEKNTFGYSFVVLISMSVACCSFYYYVDERIQQEMAYENFLKQVKQAGKGIHTDTSGLNKMYEVQSYDIAMIYSEPQKLHVDAVLTLARGNEKDWSDLVFTLTPFLTVNRIEINGESIPFDHSWIHIRIPKHKSWTGHDMLTINLSYTGQVTDIRNTYFSVYNSDHNLIPFQMAEHDYLYLTHAWFPILGEWPLYEYGNRIENPALADDFFGGARQFIIDLYPDIPPANYKISVEYPEGIKIRSNLMAMKETSVNGRIQYLFEGEKVKGAVLLGGRLEETRISQRDHPNLQMSFIYNQTLNSEHALAVAELLDRTRLDLLKLLQNEKVDNGMTFIPTGRITSPERYQFMDFNNQRGSASIFELYPGSGITLISDYLVNRKSTLQRLQYELLLHLIEKDGIFSKPLKGEQLRLFAASISAYLAHKYWELPYDKAVEYVMNKFQTEIGSYMSSSSDDQVIQRLRDQYSLLQEQPFMSVEDIVSRIYRQGQG